MMIYFENSRYTRRSEILKEFSAAAPAGDRRTRQSVFSPVPAAPVRVARGAAQGATSVSGYSPAR